MDRKNIDGLVTGYVSKERELAELGRRIRAAAHKVVVMFVDLAGSTAMKSEMDADVWLGYMFKFISAFTEHARAAGGTVVKRIGDELMLSFETAEASERFINAVVANSALRDAYSFKVAVDVGSAYHFQFEELLTDDPYGTVVDRCARIAKLARPGLVLASASYAKEANGTYTLLGEFQLKGLPAKEELFFRSIEEVDLEFYTQPLISAVNDRSQKRSGYRYVTRHLTPSDLKEYRGWARPFLARELLNVPQLPHNLGDFEALIESLPEEERSEYIGYMVDWDIIFSSYSRLHREDLLVHGSRTGDLRSKYVVLEIPGFMTEIVRKFTKGQRLHVRGIVTAIDALSIHLNYVDIAITAENAA